MGTASSSAIARAMPKPSPVSDNTAKSPMNAPRRWRRARPRPEGSAHDRPSGAEFAQQLRPEQCERDEAKRAEHRRRKEASAREGEDQRRSVRRRR
jgi:hypothetical protein